jgi:hypothetical protein
MEGSRLRSELTRGCSSSYTSLRSAQIEHQNTSMSHTQSNLIPNKTELYREEKYICTQAHVHPKKNFSPVLPTKIFCQAIGPRRCHVILRGGLDLISTRGGGTLLYLSRRLGGLWSRGQAQPTATRDIGTAHSSPHNAPPLPLSSRPKSGHNITAWFNMTLLQDSGLQVEQTLTQSTSPA